MVRQMKDSGIEWIGAIPSDWNIVRMKSCISQRDGGAWGEESTGENGDIVCLRIADFDYSKFRFKDTPVSELTHRHYPEKTIQKLTLQKNDILIEKSGGGEKTPVGRTVLFDKQYHALFANFMDRIKCSEFIDPEFMQYVFVTFYKNNYTRNYIKQTTGIQNLDLTYMLAKENVPLPNLEEQKRIIVYLNQKCAEIDSVIEKTTATIDEYRNLRQSIIANAVTRGIRQKRATKASGIKWNETIPCEWESINPKALFALRKDKAKAGEKQLTASQQYGVIYQDEYMELTGTRIVTVEKDFDILKHVEEGDFVISMRSFQGGLEYSEKSGSISSAYVMLIPDLNLVYPRFYKWLFKSSVYINALQSTSNLVRDGQAMRYSNFAQVRLYSVPLDEQKEIADYLDKKCAEIDTLIEKKTALLEEMESYKKSVIYEYVTGKKDVREI